MINTLFSDVYDNFFLQIGHDAKLELLKMQEEDLNEILYLMLTTAMVKFKRCKKKLQDNIDKENSKFLIELDLEEILILSNCMTLIWLKPRVMRLENLKIGRGDRDFKTSDPAKMLNILLTLKDVTNRDLDSQITSYTYNGIKNLIIKR